MTQHTHQTTDRKVVIVGGGPSGLAAAYELTKFDYRPIVLEKLDKVGGISRTEEHKGYYFDMGGHRFFTKSKEVNEFWHEILTDEFLRRPRLSRIYYEGKFFDYPLKALNALTGLGIVESVLIAFSYARWQIFPYRQEDTFEEWVTNRFGKRLFLTFFKTYTEKVWGIPCSELKAEWAAQRIKNLSLGSALVSMFFKPGTKYTTLIDAFDYPRRGPGMMWTTVKERVKERGGEVWMDSEVVQIEHSHSRVDSVTIAREGKTETLEGSHFISSMPITEFVYRLQPQPPQAVLDAASKLKYRDFVTVCLIINKAELFPDNWIYIHDPEVTVGRIQNFKNWSPDMVPDASKSSLGMEYFCNEGDALWTLSDEELIELGKREIAHIGLARYEDVEDGCVFRVPKTYPVYDADYHDYLDVLREYVEGFDNFQTIGRNGLHRYNNQDHAMLTGMYAVRNIVLGQKNDLWVVNAEQEYHEEIREDHSLAEEEVREVIHDTFAHIFRKLDPVSLGVSLGSVIGILLFLATILLVAKGGAVVGPHLQLLHNFFPGYTVTPLGSLLGLAYGFLIGFVLGWGSALIRNFTLYLHVTLIQRRGELAITRNILDYIY